MYLCPKRSKLSTNLAHVSPPFSERSSVALAGSSGVGCQPTLRAMRGIARFAEASLAGPYGWRPLHRQGCGLDTPHPHPPGRIAKGSVGCNPSESPDPDIPSSSNPSCYPLSHSLTLSRISGRFAGPSLRYRLGLRGSLACVLGWRSRTWPRVP